MKWTEVVLISLLVACFIIVPVILFLEIKMEKKYKESNEGITIFREKMSTYDYISFCNACVSYLIMDSELDLHKYLDAYRLQISSNSDYILLERTINQYPIIACNYVGNGIYKINKEAIVRKMEMYQNDTQEDTYTIPLFDNRLVMGHNTLFNFQMQYNQMKTLDTILADSPIAINFASSEFVLDRLNKAMFHNAKRNQDNGVI